MFLYGSSELSSISILGDDRIIQEFCSSSSKSNSKSSRSKSSRSNRNRLGKVVSRIGEQ